MLGYIWSRTYKSRRKCNWWSIRKLKEELGVEAEEKDLQYIATIKSTKNPKNMEFAYVYLLRCNKKIEEYTFKDDEVSEVKYVLYKDLEKMVEEKSRGTFNT